MKSSEINSKNIYAFQSKNQFLDFIQSKKKILIALNAEKLNKSNKALDEIINSNIGYPDGIGAVWALKRKGINAIKIAGAEFWLKIIEKYQKEKSFYFIGATDEVILKTISKLRIDYPSINIMGYRNGFLKEVDIQHLINDFKIKKPDVIFVAMGSPRQEFVMAKFLNEYPCLYMGLGGSFDVYSGAKKRAPKIFISLGLEWFYRLIKEPTRISRQINLVKFFFKIIFDKL
ncbi:WecB/TagA/CpsF family glycosyltransferase [Croceivirga sp. JEA036]|uniref:WecB/TagA/CpsF family glycosyltransferase n=1 Tax=Croceivirga sp. JEA036 TaxID=2721162 RepID=UPI00143A7121|nr:WecB/TagA/CpsF family glycosyltransferase [Croceivirga sp. JEA036]NJB37083.1 WecB/TagA/CpsF family glycosyltransferase [Croceivirga sp. JEA036]